MDRESICTPPPPSQVQRTEEGRGWFHDLKGIWRIAQADKEAFTALERFIETPIGGMTVNEDLVHHVRSLQPFNMRKGFDTYTVAILRGVWDNACKNPSALHELLFFGMNSTKFKRAHHELAWSIWKLSTNAHFRIREPGTSPISKLPVEILSYIFQQLRTAWPRYPDHHGQDLWDRASHLACRKVCVRFRDTVDDTISLWTSIALDFGPKMIAFALDHTRLAPLDIVVPFDYNPTSLGPSAAKIIKYILPRHMPRVRSLEVITRSSEETDEFLALIAAVSSAPILERFHFHPAAYTWGARHVWRVSSTTFSSDPPIRLHSLVIRNTILALPSSLLQPSLVRLDLQQSPVWCSLNDMLATLDLLRGLEKFAWRMPRSALNPSRGENVRPIESFLSCNRASVELPCLQEVRLESPIAFTSTLFSYIIKPGTCSVSLLDDYTLMDSESERALEEFRSGLSTSLGSHLRRAYDIGASRRCVELRIMQLSSVFHIQRNSLCIVGMGPDADRPSHPLFAISAIYKDPATTTHRGPNVFSHILEEIVHWKGIDQSTSLYVTHPAVSHHRQWEVLLRSLPRLCSLELAQNQRSNTAMDVSHLIQALTSPNLVPSISRITLRSLELPLITQRELASAISRRFSNGRPRVALCLPHCTFDVDLLRMVLLSEGSDKIYYASS